jgi:lipopolysaccharide/colanic/teichoic acid biosynthesis glycosyltransferase
MGSQDHGSMQFSEEIAQSTTASLVGLAALLAAVNSICASVGLSLEGPGGMVLMLAAAVAAVWRRRVRRRLARDASIHWEGYAQHADACTHFGVRQAAAALARTATGELPAFVFRYAEERLEDALASRRFALLTGPDLGGRSRLVYEFLCAAPQRLRWVVLSHRDHDPQKPGLRDILSDTREIRPHGGGTVLVVRDLPGALVAGCVTADLVAAWLAHNPHGWVIATIRSDQIETLEASEHARALDQIRRLACEVPVEGILYGKELAEAQSAYPWLAASDLAMLPAAMCAAPRRVERLHRARDKVRAGWAVACAAGDWRRVGGTIPAPAHFLAAVFLLYDGRLADTDFEAGLAHATDLVLGLPGLVEFREDGYAADDAVVADLDEHCAPIPDALWALVFAELSFVRPEGPIPPAALLEFGRCARGAGRYGLAAAAFTTVSEMGDDDERGAAAREAAELAVAEHDDERRPPDDQHPESVLGRLAESHTTVDPDRNWSVPIIPGRAVDLTDRVFRWIYRRIAWRLMARFTVLATIDVFSVVVGLVVAGSATDELFGRHAGRWDDQTSLIPLEAAMVVVIFGVVGRLYRQDARRARVASIVYSMGAVVLVAGSAAAARDFGLPSVWRVLAAGLVATMMCAGLRAAYDGISFSWVRRHGLEARTLLVGSPAAVTEALPTLRDLTRPTRIVGFVSVQPGLVAGMKRFGSLNALHGVLLVENIGRVILVERDLTPAARQRLADLCHLFEVQVEFLPSLADVQGGAGDVVVGQTAVVGRIDPLALGDRAWLAKRLFDFVGAGFGLLATLPITVPLILVIATRGGRPLVRSFRPVTDGERGETSIGLWRLRTEPVRRGQIVDLNDEHGHSDDVGRLGRLLRARGIDEIPQLLNVLAGDMSLVGPRPLYVSDHLQLTDEQRRRYSVRPGVTGLWQVTGRERLSLDEMVQLDLAYMRDWSIPLDIEIIVKTCGVMLLGRRRRHA